MRQNGPVATTTTTTTVPRIRLRTILHEGYYVPDTSNMTEEENAALDVVHQILALRNFRFL